MSIEVDREARRQAAILKDSKDWAAGVMPWGKFHNIKFIRRASIYHDYMYFARKSGLLTGSMWESSRLADKGWLQIALEDAGWNPLKIATARAGYLVIRQHGIRKWPKPDPELIEDISSGA